GVQLESNIAEYGAGIALLGDCPTCMLDGAALEFRANVAESAGGDVVMAAPELKSKLEKSL
ncbi:MAG: hypothetical protein MN733_11580, partial [Nitrososphaera sp.]|nr:hypothetical protein [Nitrososphaera sp.]